MRHKKLIWAISTAAFCFVFFAGCAASRKVQAASILNHCRLNISGVSLDSAKIETSRIFGGSPIGGIIPNPKTILLIQNIAKGILPDSLGILYFAIQAKVKNYSEDTLWLRSAKGNINLDSLAKLPIELMDSAIAFVLGETNLELHTHLEIGSNALKILSADTIQIVGEFEFSLSPNGELIPFSVDQKKAILPEERTEFIDKARTEILSNLTELWTSTLQ